MMTRNRATARAHSVPTESAINPGAQDLPRFNRGAHSAQATLHYPQRAGQRGSSNNDHNGEVLPPPAPDPGYTPVGPVLQALLNSGLTRGGTSANEPAEVGATGEDAFIEAESDDSPIGLGDFIKRTDPGWNDVMDTLDAHSAAAAMMERGNVKTIIAPPNTSVVEVMEPKGKKSTAGTKAAVKEQAGSRKGGRATRAKAPARKPPASGNASATTRRTRSSAPPNWDANNRAGDPINLRSRGGLPPPTAYWEGPYSELEAAEAGGKKRGKKGKKDKQ